MTDKQSFEVNARFEYGAHLTPNAKCKNINIEELKSQLKSKEQECEELKHKVELMMDCASCKVDEYKQTLTEIKEIAKKTLNMVDYKTYFKRDNKSLKQEGFKVLNEILQKISECEVENEN